LLIQAQKLASKGDKKYKEYIIKIVNVNNRQQKMNPQILKQRLDKINSQYLSVKKKSEKRTRQKDLKIIKDSFQTIKEKNRLLSNEQLNIRQSQTKIYLPKCGPILHTLND
jgi:phosphomevalonate kinase